MKCILIKDRNGKNYLDIFTFDGVFGYAALMSKIDSSEMGYELSFDELLMWAKRFNQVIDMTLIASNPKYSFNPYKDINDCKETYTLMIKILDGDYWEVYTRNEGIIAFLQHKYNDTEIFKSEI